MRRSAGSRRCNANRWTRRLDRVVHWRAGDSRRGSHRRGRPRGCGANSAGGRETARFSEIRSGRKRRAPSRLQLSLFLSTNRCARALAQRPCAPPGTATSSGRRLGVTHRMRTAPEMVIRDRSICEDFQFVSTDGTQSVTTCETWMKTTIEKGPGDRESPYTPRTAEDAIAHLERILSADGADSLFSRTYWRERVQQVSATRGLTPQQRARLARLLDSLPSPIRGEEPS